MSVSSSPIAPAVYTGIKSGDEHALEKLFRERYDDLVEEARRKLEDKDAGPRVVERAFTRVWKARDRFETPEALEAFLHEAVRDGAAMEAKRRAIAHRVAELEGGHVSKHDHGAHGAQNASDAWAHVAAALHSQPDAATAKELAKEGRHHAAEHIADVARKRTPVMPIAIGVAVAAAIALILIRSAAGNADGKMNAALESPQALDRKTDANQRGSLPLDDSTIVMMGPQTNLKLARKFNIDNRAVGLTGTASFDVRQSTEIPFRVRARNAYLTALGTKFDVRSYEKEPTVLVRVREGSVEVKAGDNRRTLNSGEAVQVDTVGNIVPASAEHVATALSWVDGVLTVNGTLRDVFPQIYRWYGLTIATPDPAHLDKRVYFQVPLDSVQRAIKALEESSGLTFGYAGTNMILYDPSKKPKGVR